VQLEKEQFSSGDESFSAEIFPAPREPSDGPICARQYVQRQFATIDERPRNPLPQSVGGRVLFRRFRPRAKAISPPPSIRENPSSEAAWRQETSSDGPKK
jgi:hypothetical protein